MADLIQQWKSNYILRSSLLIYLVIHNNHISTEEVVVRNDSSEPLGGRVLSVHTHTVAIEGVGSCNKNNRFRVPLFKYATILQVQS